MTSSRLKQLGREDYGVAIICPLEVEMSAVRYMLDEEHARLPSVESDSNDYIYGSMSGHNVVIAYLPLGSQGVGAAAIIATDMKRTFPSATLRLLVGIGGGVPSDSNDIRLGDVVVSVPSGIHGGVVQYDLGKETVKGFERKGFLEQPPLSWRTRVVRMQSDHLVRDNQISTFLETMTTRFPRLTRYRRPIEKEDILFHSSSEHITGRSGCGSCDHRQVVSRPSRVDNHPVIFYGLIASSNRVIKNGIKRDEIAQDAGGALCFEMEAAGLMNDFRCIIIRGICDYADSHKNDDWHAYGAAVAAGCAKELLTYMDRATGLTLPFRTNFTTTYTHSWLHPTTLYVSRPELEQRIKTQLVINGNARYINETRTVIIWGLGGAGKSQLALRYVQQHEQHYRAVFWIEAGQRATIERDYIQIYRNLRSQLGGAYTAVSPEDAISWVKSWLQRHEGRCLWVMDGADEVDDNMNELYVDLHYYLPQAPRLDRIVTTRSSRISGMSKQGAIEVKRMTEAEAISLFQKCAGRSLPYEQEEKVITKIENEIEKKVITTIVNELECLALAVVTAGVYVREDPEMSRNPWLYLVEFQQHRAQLLAQKPFSQVHQYRESLLSTWETDFSTIQRHSQLAALLLKALGFLHSDDVIPELFLLEARRPQAGNDRGHHDQQNRARRNTHGWLEQPPPALLDQNLVELMRRSRWGKLYSAENVAVSRRTIKSAFKILQEHSLVLWQADRQSYSMHKLVHAWIHDRLDIEQKQMWSLATLELLAFMAWNHEKDLEIQQRLVPHIKANFSTVLSASEGGHQLSQTDLQCMGGVCGVMERLGLWKDEYEMETFSLQQTKRIWGLEHPKTLEGMNEVAVLLERLGRYQEAESMIRRTIEIRSKVLGHEHRDTVASLNNLAVVLLNQGHYEQARQTWQNVVKSYETTLGTEHRDTLKATSNLAETLTRLGKHDQADRLHRQTLELRKRTRGPEHPETLTSMHNLADALNCQGRHEEAEQMNRQTLELQKKVLGNEHPKVLKTMHNLAVTVSQQGRYEESARISRTVFDLRGEVLGYEHPATIESRDHLAEVLRRTGKRYAY